VSARAQVPAAGADGTGVTASAKPSTRIYFNGCEFDGAVHSRRSFVVVTAAGHPLLGQRVKVDGIGRGGRVFVLDASGAEHVIMNGDFEREAA
jgi:hypothetical protein